MRHILLFSGPLDGKSREVTDLQERAPEPTFDGVVYRPGVSVGKVMYENAEWHCASTPESRHWRDALAPHRHRPMAVTREVLDEKLQALKAVLPAFFADADSDEARSEFTQLADKLIRQCGREDIEYARERLQEIGEAVGVPAH